MQKTNGKMTKKAFRKREGHSNVASLEKTCDEKAVVKSREDEMVVDAFVVGVKLFLLSDCCGWLTYLTSILTLDVELGSTFRLFTSEKKLNF